MMGRSQTNVESKCRSGVLEAVKVGNQWWIKPGEVTRWKEKQ